MTEHPYRLLRQSPEGLETVRLRHPLADLDANRVARSLTIFRPDRQTTELLLEKAQPFLPSLAPAEVVHRVVARNPDALWAIAHALPGGGHREPDGFIATLPLTQDGLRQLVDNSFNGADPPAHAIAGKGEKPAAIYIWAAFAPGRLIGAVALVFEKLSAPLYRDADIIARATTTQGQRLSEVLGLKHNARVGGVPTPHLYVFERSQSACSENPLYDSHRADHAERELSVTVARTFDDLMRVVSIRGAVYMGEQECPFDEEFDGNDLSTTHLLGFVGGEPAGCVRIHCFADFAKIERLAVRKEFRHTRLSFQLVRAAIDLCRKKGYRRLYGHAQKRLVNFWSRFGFRVMPGGQTLVFSDFDYVEMVAELDEASDAIAIGVDPYIIIRPEGRWHLPGILEQSSQRAVTRPSIGEGKQ